MENKDKRHKIVKEKKQRKRKENHLPLAEYIYKHSPVKKGLVIKDENKPLTKYEKVMNKIYLGNYQAAKDRDFFKDKKIKAVLNCTRDIPNHFAHNKDIEYMRIPVEDSLKDKDFDLMYQYFPVIVEFIHKHAGLHGNNILIHCWAKQSKKIKYTAGPKSVSTNIIMALILEKYLESIKECISLYSYASKESDLIKLSFSLLCDIIKLRETP
jgi:protein-tyrosine phosphatase